MSASTTGLPGLRGTDHIGITGRTMVAITTAGRGCRLDSRSKWAERTEEAILHLGLGFARVLRLHRSDQER